MKTVPSLLAYLFFGSVIVQAQTSSPTSLDAQVDNGFPSTGAPLDDTSAPLRAYGKIHLSTSKARGCTAWKMEATSAANASTTVGKFLADLNLSPNATVGTLHVNTKSYPEVTIPGGAVYIGYVTGTTGHVVSAPSEDALKSYLDSMTTGLAGAVTDLKYPPYLDRFDRYGWGFYGFDGAWARQDPHGTDPDADMSWLEKYHFRFELWPQPGDFDDNYSVSQRLANAWLLKEAQDHHVAVSARLYGNLPHVKEFTDMRDINAPFMEGGWYWPILGYRDFPRQSWYSNAGRLYIARQARDEINMYSAHPEIQSWMMPYGEVGTYDWYMYHGDVSPEAVASWRDTIENKLHLSLSELSTMYEQKDHPFKSYSDVPLPEVATFAGLPGMIQDLAGTWYVRPESHAGEGEGAQWWNSDLKTLDHMEMPGSVYWFRYTLNNDDQPKWTMRDFDYDASKAAGQTVYLYDYARAVNNDSHQTGLVYLNGQKVGEPSSWGVYDVTKLLKPGTNRLALQTTVFGGRVFLSTEKPALYPYLGAERNKLWIIFNNWVQAGRRDSADVALAGERSAEPNKPIKMMGLPVDTMDDWMDIASKRGSWGHFTGEGMWAFFWYKRYGFLYGVPGTSEGGGPGDLQGLWNLYQRVMLEGINGHDQVFNVQNILAIPEEKQWFEDHMAVVKQMGRYDIAGPQVILYRSTNQAQHLMPQPMPLTIGSSHEIQSVWNWDPARGSFQSDGYSGLYVDDGGIAEGKIASYPLMMDGGNEIMTPQALKNITEWVRKGGTYITLPFTGRSDPGAPDSWPIQALTGCQVTKMREPGAGKGTVTILKDQPLFKDLAGQTFPDAGNDISDQGQEHNFLSTELKPGADCQVAATFEDGAPAIVVHKLGKGRVISLGTQFYRHIKDLVGIWLPDQQESTFLRDLFTTLGFPSPNWTTGDNHVLTQRYRTNNGLDDAVVLDNFAGGDRTIDLHVMLDGKPEKVYRVAKNSIDEVPFTMDGNTAVISQIAIPNQEVQIYYFRTHAPEDAVAHWWNYQKKMWKPLAPADVDFSSISHGRFVDKAQDLKSDWSWTQEPSAADAFAKGEVPTGATPNKPWALDIFNAVGADPTKPVYAWRTFEVSPGWLKDGGMTKLVAVAADGDFSFGKREFHLNGQLLQKDGYFDPDVSSLLKPGKNLLTVKLDPNPDTHYIGVIGALYVTHNLAVAKTVDLSGPWNINPPGIGDRINGPGATVQFPGKGSAFLPTRTFDVPADWKQKYIVTFYQEGARDSAIGAIVNENGVIRRYDHLYGGVSEVDITPFIHFGGQNTIAMLSTGGQALPPQKDWDISKVELHLYPRDEYR